MDGKAFQISLFEKIKSKIPEGYKLSQVIMDDLGVSLNSAYRKIRGETLISLDEMVQLSRTYDLNMSDLASERSNGQIVFQGSKQITNLQEMEHYFIATRAQLVTLNNIQGAHLYYSARDLPLFFYFRYRQLACFKILVWLKGVDHDLVGNNEVFDWNKIPDNVLQRAKELADMYLELPTTEIWTKRTMANTLEQIAFYHGCGILTHEDALGVLDDLERVANDCYDRARENYKQHDIHATLYYCDFSMMMNGALAVIGDNRIAFVAFSNINFVQTSDPSFCKDFEETFKLHAKMGVLISGSAERQRNEYFASLRQQIEATRRKLAPELFHQPEFHRKTGQPGRVFHGQLAE